MEETFRRKGKHLGKSDTDGHATSNGATPFSGNTNWNGATPLNEFHLTDEEIEMALLRLQQTVEHEPVPAVWTNDLREDEGQSELELSSSTREPQPLSTSNAQSTLQRDREGATTTGSTRHSRGAKRKRLRRIASGVAAAAVLVGLFTTPLGTKAIADAMQTLYIQNLMGLGQDDLSQIETALTANSDGRASNIDLKQYGSVQVTGGNREGQNLTAVQAAKLAGVPEKVLPGYDAKSNNTYFTPGTNMVFRLNVDAINGLIAHLGGKTQFPESVNGQAIVVHVPAQLSENVSGPNNKYMNLSEMQMPTVQVPSDVDLNEVRQALLDLPFLPGDIRQSLATSEDWKSTLYVPVNGKVTNLTIDGYPAILQMHGDGMDSSIMWLENGVLYQLGASSSALPSANALEALAKELAQ